MMAINKGLTSGLHRGGVGMIAKQKKRILWL
jgi:hypothetical protein